MTIPNLTDLAAGLSDGSKWIVKSAPTDSVFNRNNWAGGAIRPNARAFETLFDAGVLGKLSLGGMTYWDFTPLGLSLRNHLQKGSDA